MFDNNKIINFLKKRFNKRDILIILIIIILFFLTRIVNLEKLPIFGDEGIYIRWAKTAWHDASWRFISLTDGKQPLQTWATIPFLKLFPNNAFLAGRLFSVFCGFFSLLGIFVLLFYLFGKRAAFFGSFFYIFTPYFLFYDRMALTDSAVNAAFIWIFFFSILLADVQRLDASLIFGLVGGLSLLIKSSVRLFLGLSGLAPIIFIKKKSKKILYQLLNFYFLFSIVIFLSLIIYNVQRLSPFFHYVALKNKTFVMTFDEFVKAPFSFFFHNIKIIPYYVFSELGYVLGFIGALGLFSLYKKNKRLAFYITLWFILPYLLLSFFSKVIFPRYLIFFASLFLILAVYFISALKNKAKLTFITIFLISIIYFDYTILFNPKDIPLPEIDRGQYITGITAGWGVPEIIDFVRVKSVEKPVVLLAEGNFGVIGDMLEVFIRKDDRIFIKGYWPLNKSSLAENIKELDNHYVFVVFSHRQEFPSDWPIKFIKKFEKPNSKTTISLFELIK
jgi:4-amino-4-deoxy-L-arabinose transferase-like glycosyltransferase